MRDISKIIIHCSDSEFGDATLIDSWHKERSFKKIGYHYVILNGCSKTSKKYNKTIDGLIENGRDLSEIGSHAAGENGASIGICLIGKNSFTDKQLQSLKSLVLDLKNEFNIDTKNIIGHCETRSGKSQGKTCPNISMSKFRDSIDI